MNWELETKEVEMIRSRIDHVERSFIDEQLILSQSDVKVHHAIQSQQILQQVAQGVQQKAHDRIAKVVSSCLSAVFGEDAYEFKIEFERKRGKTEARILFVRDGLEVDPLTASGGGTIDVAAFALRIVCLALHRPRLRSVIIVDEPFKNVSEDFRENVKEMMTQLSHEMRVQVIQVTHIRELETGKIIRI